MMFLIMKSRFSGQNHEICEKICDALGELWKGTCSSLWYLFMINTSIGEGVRKWLLRANLEVWNGVDTWDDQ